MPDLLVDGPTSSGVEYMSVLIKCFINVWFLIAAIVAYQDVHVYVQLHLVVLTPACGFNEWCLSV